MRFISTADLVRELQISRTTLWRLRNERVLVPGTHFHRTGLSGRGRLLWCPDTITQTLRVGCWG
jgi:hypothetical protein